MEKHLLRIVENAYIEKRRLVVPLIGFPGLNLTGCNIKLAQQNYGEHFKVLKAIAEEYKPDAVFPLMDLSVEANAIGRFTVFPKEESATVVRDEFCIDELANAEKINVAYDTRLLGYVETMKLMSIGFPQSIMRGAYVTGPYTLAALMMGADDAAMATIIHPDELHKLCEFTTKKILDYVRLLIVSGAQLICILEPSAVMLGPEQFEEFSSSYAKQIIDNCKYAGVSTVYHICGNSMHLLGKMCKSGVDALSLDSREAGVDLQIVAKQVPANVVIIGNISPIGSLLKGNPGEVKNDVVQLLNAMDEYPNFILSTGCDLPQEVPIENIHAFIEAGKSYVIKYTHNYFRSRK